VNGRTGRQRLQNLAVDKETKKTKPIVAVIKKLKISLNIQMYASAPSFSVFSVTCRVFVVGAAALHDTN